MIQPIWTRNCTGCHEEPGPERGRVLVDPDPESARRNIVNVYAAGPEFDSISPRHIRPYLPGRSYLWRKLRGTQLRGGALGEGRQGGREQETGANRARVRQRAGGEGGAHVSEGS